MIVAEGLTKRFGATLAVDDVSFEARPGSLVGLVGHEGAGKTTTLRMLVGHVTPSEGRARILDKPFAELKQPLRRVGVMLDTGVHPARLARDHLRICAALAGLDPGSVQDALRLVGLEKEAGWRARRLSPGMRRRLGIAGALLGDPEVLILDEPAAGLDSEGVRWLRALLRSLADDGRTVLVASQGSDEVEEIADHVLVMDRGTLLTESAPDALTGAEREVLVRSPGAEVLAEEMRAEGVAPSAVSPDEVRFRDVPVQVISEKVRASSVPVWEVREDEPSLEEVVVELSRGRSSNGVSNDDHHGEHDDDPEDDDAPAPPDEEESALDKQLAGLPELERPHVVAVLAPAEGLGRTTLSFLLADVLAACCDTPVLAVALSCDHERISTPVAQEHRTTLHLADLLADLPAFDDAAHISPYVSVARSGAHVLAGPAQPEDLRALEPARLDAVLDFAGRFYPLVVLDVGDVIESSLRAIVRRADRVLLLGAPGAVDDIDERSPVLDAIEAERDDAATVVFNLVDEERLRAFAGQGSAATHVLIPQDRQLIRALDGGDFELADVRPVTRVALKRLALAVAEDMP